MSSVKPDDIFRALRERRQDVRSRWEALLRIEPVNTPLANPDTLVYLLDSTLDELFTALDAPWTEENGTDGEKRTRVENECPCGRNPYIAYFLAGTQALLETLVLCQVESANRDPGYRDAAAARVHGVIDRLARREVKGLCSLCRYRFESSGIA
jgi:hypothetical protein